MANPYLTGRAGVFGLNGAMAYTGWAATCDQNLSGAEMSHAWEEQKLIDPTTNEVIGLAATQERREMKIDFYPVADAAGNTKANAKDALELPVINAKVTLSAFDHADINGDYNYIGGGTVTFTPDGYTKMSLPLRRYLASGSDATTLSTECPAV